MNHQHKPDISKANICPPCPSDASLLDKIIYWLGIGLGSGLPKRAPGTWGTLGGLIVAIPLMLLGFVPFLVITIIASIVGIYICGRTSELMNVHDDPHIVWDEWAGMWIALLPLVYIGMSPTEFLSPDPNKTIMLIALVIAFILFRFFDIIKPFPIGWLDKRVTGGFGIMIDDIIAGIISLAILCVLPTLLLFFAFYVLGMPPPGAI